MLPASTRVFTQNYRSTVSLDGSCQVLHVERLDWHSVQNIRDCASHYDYDTVTLIDGVVFLAEWSRMSLFPAGRDLKFEVCCGATCGGRSLS